MGRNALVAATLPQWLSGRLPFDPNAYRAMEIAMIHLGVLAIAPACATLSPQVAAAILLMSRDERRHSTPLLGVTYL
jgi:hypothetical protein